MKNKPKKKMPAWKKITLETSRYLFFVLYACLMVTVLYGANTYFISKSSLKTGAVRP